MFSQLIKIRCDGCLEGDLGMCVDHALNYTARFGAEDSDHPGQAYFQSVNDFTT